MIKPLSLSWTAPATTSLAEAESSSTKIKSSPFSKRPPDVENVCTLFPLLASTITIPFFASNKSSAIFLAGCRYPPGFPLKSIISLFIFLAFKKVIAFLNSG